jgi:hypothetical protein
LQVHRIAGALEARRQLREFLAALRGISPFGIERDGDFADLRDVLPNRRLLVPDLIQAPVDATR